MIEIVYYVHGTTIDNESKLATGWDQMPLSSKGVKQTQKAALQVNSNEYDVIYSSDLVRAIESAKILFANRKNEIKIDQRLRECNYGVFTKKANIELAYKEHIEEPFLGGESLEDVEKRMRDFLKELALSNYKKIAIVSHRVPQLALDVIISKLTWESAIKKDWRLCGQWQAGWHYVYRK